MATHAPADTQGKVGMITGANTGLGFQVAKLMARDGYDTILACRSKEKAMAAIQAIKCEVPNGNVAYMQLDLSSCKSIRKFVSGFKDSGKKLNILVNNAGIGLGSGDTTRKLTEDGFEVTMGTNHLGHFLLTKLLLDTLKTTADTDGDGRIVVLASSVHELALANKMASRSNIKECVQLDLDDLCMAKPGAFSGVQSYRNSKTANILFTYELARRLDGSNVTANCLCPGFIPSTELLRNAGSGTRFFLRYIMDGLFKVFGKSITRSVEDGASDVFYLATNSGVKGYHGKYFANGTREPTPSMDETNDSELQARLWEESEKLVNEKGL